MRIEELKDEWRGIKTQQIDLNRLKDMTIEKSHPVLSGIRKQLTMELLGWLAFLIVCFTGLDADRKSTMANVLLVISVALPTVLNVYGYRLSRDLIAGPDISSSLKNRIDSLGRFAIATVVLRILLICGVGYFFLSVIHFDQRKMLLLGIAGVCLILPIYFLLRVWSNRIGKLNTTLKLLRED